MTDITPTVAQPEPLNDMKDDAIFSEGPFRFSLHHVATLTWAVDRDNRVVLTVVDGPRKGEEIFNAALTDIQKVSGTGSYLNFHIGGKKYRVEVYTGGPRYADNSKEIGFPTDILIDEINASRHSNAGVWAVLLKHDGVKVTYLSFTKMAIITIVASLLAVGLLSAGIILYQIATDTF